jgi:hypothetical protein
LRLRSAKSAFSEKISPSKNSTIVPPSAATSRNGEKKGRMAEQDEAPQVEEEVLELTEVVEETADEAPEQQTEAQDDGEEVIVSFGDEAAPASEEAPEWVRDLRKRNRELERELAEAKKAKPADIPEVGNKPTLESCEYDEERFEQEYNSYLDRKSKAEAAKTEAQKAEEQSQQRYRAKVETYAEQKQSLGVKDFSEAESEVLAALSPAQQAILIHGAQNKAQLVYALGKHTEKLRQLASITDPIEFAFAAAKLEGQAKMERRKPATNPESRVSSSGHITADGGKLHDKLSTEEWARRRNEQLRKR